jgi:integrase
MPPNVRVADDRGRRDREALSTYMGHSSVTITLDRYGHLMPGNESEAAARLDAYLSQAVTAVGD